MATFRFSNSRVPLRIKILVTVLLMLTAVVSIITYTMASLFHSDKTTYIHDLASAVALHRTQEVESLIAGYQQRLDVYEKILGNAALTTEQRTSLLKELGKADDDLVMVLLYRDGREYASVSDDKVMAKAGLTSEDVRKSLSRLNTSIVAQAPGTVLVQNSIFSTKMMTFTVSLKRRLPQGGETTLVAVVELRKLLDMARQSKVFETVILDSNGVYLSGRDEHLVKGRATSEWLTKLEGLDSHVRTMEFTQDKTEYLGGFSRTGGGNMLVGVQIPKSAVYLSARHLLNSLIAAAVILIVAAIAVSYFWSRKITGPLERLLSATRDIAKGSFDVSVEHDVDDEIGDLATSFNTMAVELKQREESLLVAQRQLVQSEKMAAFGQLSAGIAHEVKNPLAGILGFVQLSQRKVEKDSPLFKNLQVIEKETKRCKEIIDNLMKFSRQEKVEFDRIGIGMVIEDAATIVRHQLGIHNVKLEVEVSPDLPAVKGNANQLQQVMVNFFINAQQALGGEPGLVRTTATRRDERSIEVRVSDNGPGIPKDIQAKLFEPFFTTKKSGEGTGLGLAVSYGIIRDHGGEIRVESEPGEGACFIITLPVPEDGVERGETAESRAA